MVKIGRILLAAMLAWGAASVAMAQDINTRGGGFGAGANYETGQTFTVPAGQAFISAYGFEYLTAPPPAGRVYTTYIYAWDPGTETTTGPALHTGSTVTTTGVEPATIDVTPATPVAVTAGGTYVILLRYTGAPVELKAKGDVLPGGSLVARTSGVAPYVVAAGAELNVVVDFDAAPVPVPTLTEWAMIILGLLLAGAGALFVARRRQFA